jgi:hypothetical protein
MLDAVNLILGYIFCLFGSIHRKTNISYNLFGIIINLYSLLFHANIIFREKKWQPATQYHEQTPKQPP